MLVPTYWAEARVQHRERGRQVTVRRFGWSDTSDAEAQLLAELRAEEALQRILAGEKLPRRDLKVPYNGAEGVPIREEIVDRRGSAVLTRNLYGALCLNTPDALFADVDFAEDVASTRLVWVVFLALAALAVGGGAWLDVGKVAIAIGVVVALFASYGVAARIHRALATSRPAPEAVARQRIDAFAATHPDWSLRVYRTPAGYRVLATHRPFASDEADVTGIFDALDVDPMYALMCRNQHCFRARVTPKPWRIGIDKHLRPQPGVWPVKPEYLPGRRAWVDEYERRSQGFAACRFEAALGPGVVHPDIAPTLAWHDELARADRDLPIA
jgi:hypothetical protein